MIANLPLLFASGNPSALSKITASELEKFIPFMVTCSWGHDTAKEIKQPPWWPKDVKFCHPFVRPYATPKDWEARLKNVVKRCYDYHKSAFLLVFSAQLARYPRKRLRYVDNRDQTTSLYYRPSGRLLVTFRNENLYYDRPAALEIEVEKPQVKAADIYLCDNCDSHFDNLEILKAHERLCNDEPVASAPSSSTPSSSIPSSSTPSRPTSSRPTSSRPTSSIPTPSISTPSTSTPSDSLPEFLSALKLLPVGETKDQESSNINENDTPSRNSRTTANIDRGPPYPFSSLAYMKNVKQNVQRDMTYSRERVERYCCTSIPISKNVGSKKHQYPVRYRRPIDYWHRRHVFPDQRHKKILDVNGQLLLLKCKPISVNVERMSMKKMTEYVDTLKDEAELKHAQAQDKDIIFVDGMECDQPAEVEKSADPLKRPEAEGEVIDLCSDDESSVVNENCDPQSGIAGLTSVTTGVAGVACVMRGGAVLRRTAATPLAQPSQPCGARQRPLCNAVLQPHPVVLITHSLNSLQTISLD